MNSLISKLINVIKKDLLNIINENWEITIQHDTLNNIFDIKVLKRGGGFSYAGLVFMDNDYKEFKNKIKNSINKPTIINDCKNIAKKELFIMDSIVEYLINNLTEAKGIYIRWSENLDKTYELQVYLNKNKGNALIISKEKLINIELSELDNFIKQIKQVK